MKSPFLILLSIAAILGVGIGAIFIFASDSEENSVQFVDENALPTPSGNIAVQESRVTAESEEPEEGVQVTSVEVSESGTGAQGALPDAAARGAEGGPGGGGFGGGAFQQVIADNPEIAELIEKAQSGSISPEEQTKLRELISEVMESSGFTPPGGGGGFAAPTTGLITSIEGSALAVDPFDENARDAQVTVSDESNIVIVKELDIGDLIVGNSVSALARRDEEGRNAAINISLIQDGEGDGFGFGGAAAGLLGGQEGITPVRGEISAISESQITVETNQGPLRVTVVEETTISSTSPGLISDLSAGMAIVAIGTTDESGAVEARTIIAGSEGLLNVGEDFRIRGLGGARRGAGAGQGQ